LLKSNDVQTSNNEDNTVKKKSGRLKLLAIWFVPVVLIPLVWPGYAWAIGQLEGWLDGVIWQATRADRPFDFEMKTIFLRMDPVLMAIGVAGLAYSVIKRNYFILLWAFPYLLLIYFVNWVYFFHIIPIIAAFCISGAALIIDLSNKIQKKRLYKPLMFTTISAIILFGAVNSTLLITQNINSSNFELVSFVTSYLPYKQNSENSGSDKITLIGPNGAFILYWISDHVFNKNFDFKWYESRRDYVEPPIRTEKYLMITDWDTRRDFAGNNTEEHIKYVSQLYNQSKLIGAFFNSTSIHDLDRYPYTNILDEVNEDRISTRGFQWNAAITVNGNYLLPKLGKNVVDNNG
jgi:hypothetical protein